jgi:hypothetical protein
MTDARREKSGRGKRKRLRVGDIVAIPVEEDLYAYAKLYQDSNIGLYKLLSEHVLDTETVRKAEIIWWTPCVTNHVTAGSWTVIGHEEFESEEASWAPPMYSHDPLFGFYWIWHKGNRWKATREETEGLDEHGFAFPKHVIQTIYERLVGQVEVRS